MSVLAGKVNTTEGSGERLRGGGQHRSATTPSSIGEPAAFASGASEGISVFVTYSRWLITYCETINTE